MLKAFTSPHVEAIAKELSESGAQVLADNLREAHAYLAGGAGADVAALRSKAEAVREECWVKLSDGGGWPGVVWREAYLFGLLMAAAHIMDASSQEGGGAEDLGRAMQLLDMALIMGGPAAADPALQMVDVVEPTLRRANAAKEADAAEGGDDGAYMVSGEAPSAAPEIDEARGIRRVAAISLADFKKGFFKTDTPVVVEGVTGSWRGRDRWGDLRYFRREFGHRTIPVEIGHLEGGVKKDGHWREDTLLFREMVDRYLVPSNRRCRAGEDSRGHEVAYLAQHMLFDQLPMLRGDLEVPEFVECGGLEGVNAWLGTAGTVTPLHCDTPDNLLTQVVGFKYVRLYNRKQTPFLYIGKAKGMDKTDLKAQGNISPVEIEDPDLEKYPLFKKAEYEEAILGPGDCLYIPSKHWHYVRSLSPSFSVNFWF